MDSLKEGSNVEKKRKPDKQGKIFTYFHLQVVKGQLCLAWTFIYCLTITYPLYVITLACILTYFWEQTDFLNASASS